jgi:hypothetical protein
MDRTFALIPWSIGHVCVYEWICGVVCIGYVWIEPLFIIPWSIVHICVN